MGFTLTGLTEWVNENKQDLKTELVLGSMTAKHISVVNNIKFKEQIKMLDGTMNLTNAVCSHPGNNTTTLSEKIIEVWPLNYSENFCVADLEKYSFQLNMKAGSYNNDGMPMPLAQVFTKFKVEKYAEAIENMIWQGSAGLHVTPGITSEYAKGSFEGFIPKFDADDDVDKTTVFDFSDYSQTASTYIGKLQDMFNLLPKEAQSQKDVKVFLGVPEFNIYVQKLMMLGNSIILDNLNKFGNENGVALIGTNAMVVPVAGMPSGRAVATLASNLILGTDILLEGSDINFTYDASDDILKARIKMKAGTQYLFPQYIITNATS